MRLKKMHWLGIIFGLIIILVGGGFFAYKKDVNLLLFLAGIGVGVIALPFVVGIIMQGKKEQGINIMFLEFSRNLAESVTTGTPISRSIVNMRNKNYGDLSIYIKKLSNQIELGVPVDRALQTFANDIDSPVIKRAVALIREAERAGGEIDFILESVAKSISEADKLQKQRKAAVYNLVVQGYIIFFIFIGIMLVMQFRILPLTSEIGNLDVLNINSGSLRNAETQQGAQNSDLTDLGSVGRSFLILLMVQGLFAGLTIGKLSEGSVKAGIKHSFILTIAAFLIASGANLVLGALLFSIK